MRQAPFLFLLTAALPLSAHETITTKLTWSTEISRIVYKNCLNCHREGGVAFSLLTYQEARPWAKAIKEEVLERRMPPWGAVKGFGEFANDEALTQEDLHLVADWVEGGAPEGDPRYLPDAPTFVDPQPFRPVRGLTVSNGNTLKTAITVRAVRPDGLSEGASLKAVAVLPGGAVEPLLWLYDYKPQWPRNYAYKNPVRLPRGARILLYPPGAGKLVLAAGGQPD